MEGESDEKSLPLIVAKVLHGSPHPKAVNLRGRGNLLKPDVVRRYVAAALQVEPSISKVLVCVDSECTEIDETRSRVSPLEQQLRKAFPKLAASYVIVDHSLEGWLLADHNALRQVLGPKARIPSRMNAEDNCRPAEVMAQVFQRNDRGYLKTRDAPSLADAANPATINKASPTFRAFQKALLEVQISGKNTPPRSRQ